ncbi:hypothetical protein B7494_g3162 [Chlorociboria aeruginascens]|nr:hypothetical protein B7494_g3162 [Chlorociboria aeruginascens]
MPQLYHVVAGTTKEWLGVEWDDPSRGKHDGEHQGVRYFTCQSRSKTTASFVRPSRTADPAQSFVEAVHQKYAAEITAQSAKVAVDKQIEISGKVVQEVGFDKIRQQLAELHELKIVLVDGLRINSAEAPTKAIREVCPKIVELDLSRNLFESCQEIVHICGELDNLRSLRINGNRLKITSEELISAQKAFQGVEELEMEEMMLPWEDICQVSRHFKSLKALRASSNGFQFLPSPLIISTLTSLTLEYNEFTSLLDLLPLSELRSLEKLLLKGNQISKITSGDLEKGPIFYKNLRYVDLSYNQVISWDFVDGLVAAFPGLEALRLSHNPIYEVISKEGKSAKSIEEVYMFTLARIANLKILNFSKISPAERTNAEMFYLSRIGKALAEVPETEEHIIISQHKRYAELCEIYGAPVVVRKDNASIDPDFLEARLIKFTFHMPANTQAGQGEAITIEKEIPKGFDIYRVKGIVGRMFGLRPLSIRLIWETGEWDPVAGYEELEQDSSDEENEEFVATKIVVHEEKGKWMRREVELEDSTRQVGFCVDGMEAKQCHYRHIMPMSISGLREVGLTDWPTWYRGMNPEYFAPSTSASTRAGCGNGNRRTRARGCGNDYCHLRPEDVRNAALDGAGRGGTGGYPNGAYPARGRGARSNRDDLGEHILARLRGLARQDAIVGSVERKAAVARPGSARNNVLIERAADRDAKNWEEESSVGEAKAKVAGGEKEKLVDV